jgi:uncharacterized protein
MKINKLSDNTSQALEKLEKWLKEKPSIAIAYSGGMDSSFLALAAQKFCPDNYVALFVCSDFVSYFEEKIALQTAQEYSLNLKQLKISPLDFPKVAENTPERCYHCKKAIFELLLQELQPNQVLCEGSVVDDDDDYRPGKKALAELKVISPLKDSGFSKKMIAEMLTHWNASNLIRSAQSCLATRISTGEAINKFRLEQIEKGEAILRNAGLKDFRLRHHGKVARIEVKDLSLEKALKIIAENSLKLKSLGFKHVALDVDGYQKGSMNRLENE